MSSQATLGQFVRYATVGLVSNVVLYLAYLALTATGVGAKLAMSLLYLLGVVQTFIFNKRWSFRHGGMHGPAFVRYCVSYLAGYLINLVALMVLVNRMGYPPSARPGRGDRRPRDPALCRSSGFSCPTSVSPSYTTGPPP